MIHNELTASRSSVAMGTGAAVALSGVMVCTEMTLRAWVDRYTKVDPVFTVLTPPFPGTGTESGVGDTAAIVETRSTFR